MHTPGPWKVIKETRLVSGARYFIESDQPWRMIALVDNGKYNPEDPTNLTAEGNAKLLAAAPELLDVAHMARALLMEVQTIHAGGAYFICDMEEAIARLDRVIKKASY